VCRIFSQLAEALAAVHSAVDPATKQGLELIHRDVSPENVLLSRDGAVKLADFGIARAMTQISTTRPDAIRGKVRYLAPEQVLGEPLSAAVDVWALGVSLYETLTLKRPFPEENEGQTLHAIATAEVPRLDALRPDLPHELVMLVHRCLARQPANRYPDCADLALELERLASSGSGGVTSRMIGNWVERLLPEDPVVRALSGQHAAHQPAQRTPAAPATPVPVKAPEAPFLTPAAPPVTVEPPPPAPSSAPVARRSLTPVVVVALLLAVLFGGYVTRSKWLPRMRPTSVRAVVVTSSPSGAVVKQGSIVLGQTPWAGDVSANEVELSVDAPGYDAQRRTLPSGESSLHVVLKRKR
jgi:serine/threonine-protein kinase